MNLPALPMPTWPRAAPADERRRLPECLLLAALLHALLVAWLGNAPGGSARPGQGVAGSLNVMLRGYDRPLMETATAAPVPPQTGPAGTAAQPRIGGSVRSPTQEPRADEGPGAARLGTWAPAPDAVPVPIDEIPPRPARPADDTPPLSRPTPSAAAAPTLTPIAPEPAPAPPVAEAEPASPIAEPAPLAAPREVPVPAPPVPTIPPIPTVPTVPTLPPLPALAAPTPVEPAPLPLSAPMERPAVRPPPEAATTSAPRAEPVPPAAPAAVPSASPGALAAPVGPDAGPLRGHDVATPPAPAASTPAPLNLQLARPRGGELSGRMAPGALPLLPRPPERPSKLANDIENAARRDCRTAHAGMGLLAAVPLAADALSGAGCKW